MRTPYCGGQAHLLGEVGADGECDDTERGTAGVAVLLDVGEDRLGGIDGNGEADAGVLLGAVLGNHRVDADDFALGVEQRAAGVAGVDGGIGLDGVFDGHAAFGAAHGTDGADDAGGHGAAETEGIADGVDLLTDLEIARAGEDGGDEVRRVDLEKGEVVQAIFADDLSLVAMLVVGLDLDVSRVGDDVVVGEDVALLIENEAGALVLLGYEAHEEVEGDGAGGDVDDGGDDALVDGDVVHLRVRVLGRGVSLGQRQRGAGSAETADFEVGDEVAESCNQDENQKESTQGHSG